MALYVSVMVTAYSVVVFGDGYNGTELVVTIKIPMNPKNRYWQD